MLMVVTVINIKLRFEFDDANLRIIKLALKVEYLKGE